jgi:hypothetical protein
MPAVPAEVEKKRLQLKRELFSLLLQHSDGILKINVEITGLMRIFQKYTTWWLMQESCGTCIVYTIVNTF